MLRFLIISFFAIILLSVSVFPWGATWVVYRNISLSPDESSILFEFCNLCSECGDPDTCPTNREVPVYIVDINGKWERGVTKSSGWLVISPDGGKALIAFGHKPQILDLVTLNISPPLFISLLDSARKVFEYARYWVEWSPDGKKIICNVEWERPEVYRAAVYNISKNKEILLNTTAGDYIDWKTEEEKIDKIMIKNENELWIYNKLEGSYTPLVFESNKIVEAVMDKDGKNIYYATQYPRKPASQKTIFQKQWGECDFKVYELETGKIDTIYRDTSVVSKLKFSFSGDYLMFVQEIKLHFLNCKTKKANKVTELRISEAYWLKNDKRIAIISDGSLYLLDLEKDILKRLTVSQGRNAGWLSPNEIAVMSVDRYWKIHLDKLGVEDLGKELQIAKNMKGQKYEVYTEEIKEQKIYPLPTLNRIWVKDLSSKDPWIVRDVSCNWDRKFQQKKD